MQDISPLTGLPGNKTIRRKISEIIKDGSGIIAYIDIVDFKPFNDYYGFALGDSIIRRLAGILKQSLSNSFIGHIGGDDFLCIGFGEEFRNGVERARQRFRSIVPGFYSLRDRELGGIESFDRQGNYKFFPLLDISIVFSEIERSMQELSVETLAAKAGKSKKMLKGEQIPLPVFPVLERMLKTDYSEIDAKALIEACGVLREEKAVLVLSNILTGNYSWKLRKSAALALGFIGNEHCSRLLIKALADTNPHVRTRAVEGLVISKGFAAGKYIFPLINDSSTWVRRAVLRGIGQAGWDDGLSKLRIKAKEVALGKKINTDMERKAALQGISFLGFSSEAKFLLELYKTPDYSPKNAVYAALCSVGTNYAAEEVIKRNTTIPEVLNLTDVNKNNLIKLDMIARNSLLMADKYVVSALRFYEGFPIDLSSDTVSTLKKCLGVFTGELLRRLILLLDSRCISADSSCVARIANRIELREEIGIPATTAFLSWISFQGGVKPGRLLKSFLRSNNRAFSASAALAVRALVNRGLTQNKN